MQSKNVKGLIQTPDDNYLDYKKQERLECKSSSRQTK